MFDLRYLTLATVSALAALVLWFDGALFHAACASAAGGCYAALSRRPPAH